MSGEQNKRIPRKRVLGLKRQESGEHWCSWNPKHSNLLATASEEKIALIWNLQNYTATILNHNPEGIRNQDKRVLALDWNHNGSVLATGCGDSVIRLWNADGFLLSSMSWHQGCITDVKWHPQADILLSSCSGGRVNVWETITCSRVQTFTCPKESLAGVVWQNLHNLAFYSMSDHSIYLCRLGTPEPCNYFIAHSEVIQRLRWDHGGNLLASCSSDRTVKVWKGQKCIREFKGHTWDVYDIKWCPEAHQANSPVRLLASSSGDYTVRVWEIERGECLRVLGGHTGVVHHVDFNSDGQYLASGADDQQVRIWNVQTEELIYTFKGKEIVCDLSWSPHGDRVCVTMADGRGYVLDVSR